MAARHPATEKHWAQKSRIAFGRGLPPREGVFSTSVKFSAAHRLGQATGEPSCGMLGLRQRLGDCKRICLTIRPSGLAEKRRQPLNSGVRPMRILLALATLFFSSLSYAQISPALDSATGLWQFGEHTVWIHIGQDGSASQCRIALGGTVYVSTGVVIAPSSIQWRKIWGVDQVSLHDGTMVLKGPYGAFEYHRTSQPMAAACSASL